MRILKRDREQCINKYGKFVKVSCTFLYFLYKYCKFVWVSCTFLYFLVLTANVGNNKHFWKAVFGKGFIQFSKKSKRSVLLFRGFKIFCSNIHLQENSFTIQLRKFFLGNQQRRLYKSFIFPFHLYHWLTEVDVQTFREALK